SVPPPGNRARAFRGAAATYNGPRRLRGARLERARARVLPVDWCRARLRLDDLEMDVTDRASSYAPLPETRLAVGSKFGKWDRTWFPSFLGIELEDVRLDYARMRLKYKPEFNQPAGVVHGGVIASLIDTVVVPVIGGGYDHPHHMFTIDLQVRYLAPIIEPDLLAEA